MDDWKLNSTPVVRLKRSYDRSVYFIAGDSDPAAGPIASRLFVRQPDRSGSLFPMAEVRRNRPNGSQVVHISVVRYPRYLFTYRRYLCDDTSIAKDTIYRGIS